MPEKKKKRELTTTIEHIERYHSRRSAFVIHATLSAAIQVAMWLNWYSSYVVRGYGIQSESPFFSDRFIVSMVLVIFLIGHFVLMRMLETKDKLVILALKQAGEDDFEPDREKESLAATPEESSTDYEDPILAYLSNTKR